MSVPCLVSALLLASPVLAQGGYTTEKHPEHGLTFPRARHYEAVPTQPSEEWIVLKFVEKKSQVEKKGRRQVPQMWIVRIDLQPGAVRAEPDDEKRSPVDFADYLELEMKGWSAGEALAVEEKKGWEGSEYVLEHEEGFYRSALWAYVWKKQDTRTFAIMGFCHESDFDEQVKIWRHTASRMKFKDPSEVRVDRERVKWERHYERKNFIDAEHRPGWKAATKHRSRSNPWETFAS